MCLGERLLGGDNRPPTAVEVQGVAMSNHATALFEVTTWDEKPYQEIESK